MRAEKPDHPVEARKDMSSLPDSVGHQATLPQNIEIVPVYYIFRRANKTSGF
jgi:hypothetical protein